MASLLERVLLCSAERNNKIWKTLLELLEHHLYKLRAVSWSLHSIIQSGCLFRKLYVRAPLLDTDDPRSLENIAPFCHTLTIKVGFSAAKVKPRTSGLTGKLSDWFPRADLQRRSTLWTRRQWNANSTGPEGLPAMPPSIKVQVTGRAKTQGSSAPILERRHKVKAQRMWRDLLSHFRKLRSLTLRINGDHAWPRRTAVEDMLVILRSAIESAQLPELRTFSLVPVHAMAIIHLRWHGFGSFGSALASGAAVWTQVDTLEIRIRNPLAGDTLTTAQALMCRKVLYEYLRSFAPFLRCLRLIWLGNDGPNPLALHLEPGLGSRAPIQWRKLEELWLGNTILPNKAMSLVQKHARPDTRVKILRSIRRDSMMEADDSIAWIEILPPSMSDVGSAFSERSSVYSRPGRPTTSHWAPGISRSSQDVTIMFRR